MKSIVPFLISAVAAVPVFADDPGWSFAPDGEGRFGLVSAPADGAEVLSVPSEWGGQPVLAVGPNAFAACAGLAEVRIPASVEWIDPFAFSGCMSLERIVVDSGNAVYSSADGVLFDESGTFLLNCPEGKSGDYAVPDAVRKIDAGAFAGCADLRSVVVPPGVAQAGAGAFSGCSGLQTLFLPAGSPCDPAAMDVPASCTVVRYRPGGLDDPRLPPRWAVSFSANGGSGTMSVQVVGTGVSAFLSKNAFSRKGWTFAGWARSPAGKVEFRDGQSVRDLVSSGKTVRLYAQWKGNVYSVVFHDPGRSSKVVRQKFSYGTRAALRKDPFSNSGCVLVGWSKKPGGKVYLRNGQKVLNLTSAAGRNIHLYAVWAVRNYKVAFFANGGKGTMPVQKFAYGKAKKLRANAFRRTGFTFAGWARKPGSAATIADRENVANLTRKGGTVGLYAKWRRNRYSVQFLPNGGTGTMAPQKMKWGVRKTLSKCAFSRSGFVFAGWAAARTGKIVHADGAEVVNLTKKNGATVVLHAQWAVKNYSVCFDANGGVGAMADQSFVYGKAKNLRENAFTRDGYLFLGWSEDPSASKPAYKDRETVSNLTAKGITVVLYAVWTEAIDRHKILCLGDSITEGYACAGLPYPSRLARMTGCSVVNCGVGGTTSAAGLSTAERNISSARAATVCILFGSNDAIHGRSPEETKSNLRQIVRICRKYGCTPILGTPPHQSGSHERFNDAASAIASAIRSLAREESVALADANAAFGGNDSYLNPKDGLHLSESGGDLLARLFRNAM